MPLVILGILFIVLMVYRVVQRKKKRRSPFTDHALLRLPGHSLNVQIAELSENLSFYFFVTVIVTMTFTQVVIEIAGQQGHSPSPGNYPWHYGIFTILIGGLLFKIVTTLNIRNRLRLGYEGELVTAQELHKLMPEGNHVYHDFPAENFNIDHVVVGPAGVFAIETKARSKRISGSASKEANAAYHGNEIVFPDAKDRSYLDQARRQAKWLSNWLKSAVGEPVEVFPVVSLPGWYVKNMTKPNGTSVVNPKQLYSVIRSKTNNRLDSRKIQRINHQLDAKCRDLEMLSKQYDK